MTKFYVSYHVDDDGDRSAPFYRCTHEASSIEEARQWAHSRQPAAIAICGDPAVDGADVAFYVSELDFYLMSLEQQGVQLDTWEMDSEDDHA